MTAALGSTSLLIALFLAGWGMTASLVGARTGQEGYFAGTRGTILGQFALVTLASRHEIALIVPMSRAG